MAKMIMFDFYDRVYNFYILENHGSYLTLQCRCGNIESVEVKFLLNGTVKSCGCLNRHK